MKTVLLIIILLFSCIRVITGVNDCTYILMGNVAMQNNDEKVVANVDSLAGVNNVQEFSHLKCLTLMAKFKNGTINKVVKFMQKNRSRNKHLVIVNGHETERELSRLFNASILNFNAYFGELDLHLTACYIELPVVPSAKRACWWG